MRHQKKGRKFGRETNERKALLRSLVYNFILKKKIKTTEAKARELRPVAEKLVTRAKTDTLANRKIIISKIGEQAAKKLFNEIAPSYKNRAGGYTRIMKLPPRKADGSKMAVIEFV